MNILKGAASTAFHFEPHWESLEPSNEPTPLLYSCQPPGRSGRVTVFLRTRRTLRRRLGVHDLGDLDGVLKERPPVETNQELCRALAKPSNWSYLFPPEEGEDRERGQTCLSAFAGLLKRTLAG